MLWFSERSGEGNHIRAKPRYTMARRIVLQLGVLYVVRKTGVLQKRTPRAGRGVLG
jgi:hypothetical protein